MPAVNLQVLKQSLDKSKKIIDIIIAIIMKYKSTIKWDKLGIFDHFYCGIFQQDINLHRYVANSWKQIQHQERKQFLHFYDL